MRIGVFGGSFDPVHIGHLVAAEYVREAFQLDRVLFVPAARPPHKENSPKATPGQRLKMLEAAVQSHLQFAVSDIEIRREGPSYTVDTLRELARSHQGAKLYFILGTDLLPDIQNWHDWRVALEIATFVGVLRSADPGRKPPPEIRDAVKQVAIPAIDVSSSLIRTRVAEGKSIRYLVPAPVADLIEQERLYRLADA
ncbi:MAG: nicotinate (nicotinamide) nucleotide adenylyltransferase [Candidatus Lindowbacteria bacterium RIFCSPLOWO2_12_FULL_62_27]|nr:MAG: nicotinate (nicotinamide) nucleotide adenylyltransferase [Candidatus Lindowbacteria bacterium RIFCSPLOWO2_12_FULL_62_27]OGH63856.1 MAG: nicotinate (nicotinamide) nucleotide adenylyltransferase [Candidatus Lindowbacteria bacterium RIFCSPLOWO2_02_FULL_62_12]